MAELSWGVKRTCNSCGARFYDLRKSPMVCPKCGATYEIHTATRGKRERASAKEVVLPLDDFDLALVEGADSAVADPALLEEEDAEFSEIPADLDEDI
ncbi:MAG: TIGR02300 family protein [Proteobacteria bacterium]|nr:TIGR02300 family protein [Pseudomonadota bacterium]